MTELVIATIITLYANLYGVPPDYALCVAQAESRLDPAAIGDSGRAAGLWQFHEPFWREMRAEMGRDADPALRFDVAESTETAMYAMRRGFWRRWSTDCQCQPLREPVDTTGGTASAVDIAREVCYSDCAEAQVGGFETGRFAFWYHRAYTRDIIANKKRPVNDGLSVHPCASATHEITGRFALSGTIALAQKKTSRFWLAATRLVEISPTTLGHLCAYERPAMKLFLS